MKIKKRIRPNDTFATIGCPIVSPSILDVSSSDLNEEIEKIQNAGLKAVHIDVMDGKFVKNTSQGDTYLKRIKSNKHLYKDVHIMVKSPFSKVPQYKKAGANCLTFHYEAYKDNKTIMHTIKRIHKLKMEAGISIKPNTPISDIVPFLPYVDRVLVMSVEPGLGGQKFIESSCDRIAELKREIEKVGSKAIISVDGGINDMTGPRCRLSGADVLVSGKYLFGKKTTQKELNDRRADGE